MKTGEILVEVTIPILLPNSIKKTNNPIIAFLQSTILLCYYFFVCLPKDQLSANLVMNWV